MDFDRLLNEVTALVNERGRVSLAAVAQYFDLQSAQLDAIREELVEARGSVALENDRILVALDRTSGPVAPAAPGPVAERRHLTVMFVDLVGSTGLAGRLDPEDLRAVVREYQQVVADASEPLHGYTAQYLGDGVLIYFGYPHAHGDDSKRALYAAHEILASLPALNRRLDEAYSVTLQLRIGVHTGLVVVGDVGAGARTEALALGNTPNVAARLESIAAPGTVLVSESTRALLGDQFDLVELGPRQLKGMTQEINVFESRGPSGVASAFDQAVTHKLLPLAGRRGELHQLLKLWERSRAGYGAAVLISGEAGIGKSRLIQALKDHLVLYDERWTALRASPYDANTPLHPVIALLRQVIGISDQDTPQTNYERIVTAMEPFAADRDKATMVIATLCGVVPDKKKSPPLELRAAAALFENLFLQLLLQGPRLLVVEDLHWLDPTTMDMTQRLMLAASQQPMMVVVSARPGFDDSVLDGLELQRIDLQPLPREDALQMIASVAGARTLAPEVCDAIVGRTDGVPAFIEELTRMLLDSAWLVEKDGQLLPNGPAPANIPATLQDSLMARLDRLGDAKAVAQEAAVLGRAFSSELLGAISAFDQKEIDAALARLEQAQVIRRASQPGLDDWRFSHAMLQEAAYQSLLRATRQRLHLNIAQTIEERFAWLAAQRPERVARHFTLGNDVERAIGYWQWAGEQAVEKAAMREALAHAQEAMRLLDRLGPSTLRDQRELALLSIKGSATVLTQGWAARDLADIYPRALELVSRSAGQEHVDFQVLGGLCAYHLVRGELDTVSLLADRLLRQGTAQHDRASLTVAHVCLCISEFFRGHFGHAREQAQLVERHHDPDLAVPVSFLYGQDPAVIADTMVALITWLEGDVPAAMRLSERAVAASRRTKTPFSLLWASAWHSRLLFESGHYAQALDLADHTAQECERKGYTYVGALANLLAGVATQRVQSPSDGIERVRAAMRTFDENPNALSRTYFNALSAAGEMAVGEFTRADAIVQRGLETSARGGERFWRSELYRVLGELQSSTDRDAARASLVRAIDQSRSLGAYRLMLRAAHSLYRFAIDTSTRQVALGALRDALEHIEKRTDDAQVKAAIALGAGGEDSGD